jgi:alcohol dehydrogenase
MANSWEIIGNFMYPIDFYRLLLDLMRAGLLYIGAIRPRTFQPSALPEAMDAAATAGSLGCVVVTP